MLNLPLTISTFSNPALFSQDRQDFFYGIIQLLAGRYAYIWTTRNPEVNGLGTEIHFIPIFSSQAPQP